MRFSSSIFALVLSFTSAFALASATANPGEIVQLADYVSVDYPDAVQAGKVINEAEYLEMQEFSARIEALGQENQLSLADLKNMRELRALIEEKTAPDKVALKAREVSLSVSQQFNLILTPKIVPDLAQAAVLYQQNCMSCHGETGKGDGVLAMHQDPAPTNFTDLNRAKLRSINGLYNTITMGVAETGMVSYAETLSTDERWSLAFYVSQLFASKDMLAQGKKEWDALKNKTDFTPDWMVSRTLNEEMAAGEPLELIAYLRHNPGEVWDQKKDVWLITEELLQQSFDELKNGNSEAAYTLALESYLSGFELVEPVIDAFDKAQRQKIEMLMLNYRAAVQENNVVGAEEYLHQIQSELVQTQSYVTEQETQFFSIFLSALIILLREGLEIILVLAVMFVLVRKTEQKKAPPYIHMGWVSAIISGILLWYFSHQFISISGGEREVSEGLLSVLAAGVLFYVGFWIHRQQAVQQWQTKLYGQLDAQLGQKSLWGLSFIAFIAVFREILEIALFYETLWLQTGGTQLTAIASGIVLALIVLLVLSFAIGRFSMRLPFATFFKASSLLIIVLSVIFLGSGLQALSEAGKFPIYLLNMPSIEILGIYPNLWILLSQLTLALLGTFIWYRHRSQ